MVRKEFMNIITNVINDWKNTDFSFLQKDYVPGLDDANLTYGCGQEKKGIELNSCVLFVDIRNSVQLIKDKQDRTMGRLYSVFTHCMLLAARQEGGLVRNIIGDRVMIVFPQDHCCTKAVNCAITINHIAMLINKKIDNLDFKCGIGIDYGRMRVMKVGVVTKGAENDDNKGLVWVGYPANFASRLTDCANKEFTDIMYQVDATFCHYNYWGTNTIFGSKPSGWYREKQKLTAEELAQSLEVKTVGYGSALSVTKCINPVSIKRIEEKYKYDAILVSDAVYKGFKKEKPNDNSIQENWWKLQKRSIRDIDFDVWGADLHWDISD
ncbi:adenylate/guanylate cyclase domain-containing protein [Segatella copri]|uniref:adenylate/guanylate cyclase domain-containing protein n=1 Tax=Segatella copri TaxID=165179 RepID=UPI003F8AC9CB